MGTTRSIEGARAGEWQGDESTTISLSRAQYAQEKLGITLWPKIEAIYDLIDIGVSRFLIRSCNGAGKSTLLASIIVEELQKYDDIQVICTAATATQLRQTLWRAVKRQARTARINTDNLNANSWDVAANRRALAISPSSVESGQGFHAERVVVIIDEATSMSSDKISALLSNATGRESLVLFTYNPINPDATVFELEQGSTPFEQILDEDGLISRPAALKLANSSEWLSVGISAFEHPNVIHGREIIKGAVTRDFIESVLRIDSVQCDRLTPDAIILPWNDTAWTPTPEATARICGEWSQAQATGFISGSVVVNSWKIEPRVGLRIAGADIGGGGEDPSVWTHFIGNTQMPFQSIKTSELGIVATMLDAYCIENQIDAIAIDDTGVGHGVTDRLQEKKPKYRVMPINFGSSPKNFPEIAVRKPANARCEMYLLLEKQMRSGMLRIAYDKELQRELCSQKIVAHKQSETIRIEDKNLIKKRIGRSPNKADATALARYGERLVQHYNQPILY